MSEEDEEFEEMLDRERYLALECDELRVEEGKWTEIVRLLSYDIVMTGMLALFPGTWYGRLGTRLPLCMIFACAHIQ